MVPFVPMGQRYVLYVDVRAFHTNSGYAVVNHICYSQRNRRPHTHAQTGRLAWVIRDAHPTGATALTPLSTRSTPSSSITTHNADDTTTLLSGGADGTLRLWQAGLTGQTLVTSIKVWCAIDADLPTPVNLPTSLKTCPQAHQARINHIAVAPTTFDSTSHTLECCTAATDGSCMVWNVTTGARIAMLSRPCSFTGVVYHPDASQLVTVGTCCSS